MKCMTESSIIHSSVPESPFIPFSKINPRILLFSATFLAHIMKTSAIGEFVILKKKKHSHDGLFVVFMKVIGHAFIQELIH